jgi:hypothetical protein
MRFFASGFFHESVSPSPRVFFKDRYKFCSKIRGDIRKSRCIPIINNTGCKFATNVTDNGGKIFPPVSLVLMIPVANLPPVSTIPAANLPPVANNGNSYQTAENLK